jgi:hypothetical protein
MKLLKVITVIWVSYFSVLLHRLVCDIAIGNNLVYLIHGLTCTNTMGINCSFYYMKIVCNIVSNFAGVLLFGFVKKFYLF